MCGFIAQLVEHCTGIAEVTGSNPVEALIFSQASSFQLLKLENLLRWSLFTFKVHCLAQEHNTMFPTRARTQSGRSGKERTNHAAAGSSEVILTVLKTASIFFKPSCLFYANGCNSSYTKTKFPAVLWSPLLCNNWSLKMTAARFVFRANRCQAIL